MPSIRVDFAYAKYGYNGGGPVSLFELAESRFEPVSASVQLPSFYKSFQKLDKNHRVPAHLYPGIEALSYPSSSTFYPGDREWIVRNLTTGEFVRSTEFALKPRLAYPETYISSPRIKGVGFSKIVIMRST